MHISIIKFNFQPSFMGNIEKDNVNEGKKPVDKRYKCTQCPFSFDWPYHLKRHMRTHTGEKPYECQHCDLRFSLKCNLIDHLRVHTGEKPFECQHCGKQFRQVNHLTYHQRVHTREMPFECKSCGKAFTLRHNLNRHFRHFHGDGLLDINKGPNEPKRERTEDEGFGGKFK